MWRGGGGICTPFVVGKDCRVGGDLIRLDGVFFLTAQVLTISQIERLCDLYVLCIGVLSKRSWRLGIELVGC